MERFTKSERNIKISSKPYSSTSTWGLFNRTAISFIHQPESLMLLFNRKAKAIKTSWAGVGFRSGRRRSKKFLFIQPLTDWINLIRTRNYVYSNFLGKFVTKMIKPWKNNHLYVGTIFNTRWLFGVLYE